MTAQAPVTWEDWVNAFTTLFAPANRISLRAREFATLKRDAKQSVGTYTLKVTNARSRLMAEARRLAPAGVLPFEHAWSVFTTTSFDHGLLPHLRLELIREDKMYLSRISSASEETRSKQFTWNEPYQPRSYSHCNLCCSNLGGITTSVRREDGNDGHIYS